MTDRHRSSSEVTVHPESADLSVELSGTVVISDEPDLIWTTWEGRLVFPAELLSDLLDREMPDLVLADGRWASVDFERLQKAGVPLVEALDAYSEDFVEFCSMADGYRITDELQDRLMAYVGGMVIADRVSVPDAFRGRKYGLLLMSLVLQELGRGRLAVAMPAAFEVPPGSPGRQEADRRNARMWETFGFERYRGDAYFLNTALTTLEDNVARFKLAVEAAEPIRIPAGD